MGRRECDWGRYTEASTSIEVVLNLMLGGHYAIILFFKHFGMSAIFLNKVSKEPNINIC